MSLTDLQNRLTVAETAIAALTAQVHYLSGHHAQVKTAIPLQSVQARGGRVSYNGRGDGYNNRVSYNGRDGASSASSARSYTQPQNDQENWAPTALSDILQNNEDVTFTINTGKNAQGAFTTTTAVAVFDGTNLTVKACADIPSLVGLTSSKPGEILYKFMNELKEANLITRTFQALPWRLCSVERDGQRETLSNLRKALTEQNE
jgi:hypothetical protein